MDQGAGKNSLSLLSLKDFEERGINVHRKWTGHQALMAVACLASEKLKEESIRKGTVNNPVERILNQQSVFDKGSSSGLSNDARPALMLARVSDEEGKEGEKTVKKLVNNSVFDKLYSKTEPWFEEEDSICDDLYSKKGLGFYVNNSRKKLLGEAMKETLGVPYLGCGNDDKEWVAECRKPKNKLKPNEEKGISKSDKKPKRKKQVVPVVIRDDLPGQFRERVEQLKGSKIGLVIEKRLFAADVSADQCRLSIPAKQIMSPEFLTDEEKRYLHNGGRMKVKYFIEPSLQEYGGEMNFKRQGNPKLYDENKKKKKTKSSYSYLLITGWVNVRTRNKLEYNDKIQLWKFRSPAEELCFALVLVEKFCERNIKNLGEDDNGTREDASN